MVDFTLITCSIDRAGIDTYRSSRITMRNWDITCGDDCLAIKAVSLGFRVRMERV